MKTVSIVIPIYNVELYLEECLDSVLGQTYKNLEIILIDDGSTDKSGMICDNYAEKDSRIVLIHQKNQGAAAAKNIGLDAANGDYLAFVDSDDYVSESWIAELIDIANESKADIVEYGFWKKYKTSIDSVEISPSVMTAEEYLEQYFSSWANSLFWNKLFTREVINSLRFHHERRCIDDEFFTYKVISNASKIVRVNKNYYYYRQRLSSAVRTREHKYQITKDAIDIRPERYEWIKNRYPTLKHYFLDNDVNYLLYLNKTGDFDSDNILLYKSVVKYYQQEILKTKLDFNLLLLWFNLARSCHQKKNQELLADYQSLSEDYVDYYE